MRFPAVSGQFYSSDSRRLSSEVDAMLSKASAPSSKARLASLVSPHAGHIYSGPIAAYSFKALKQSFPDPPSLILVGPNHTGMGSPVSLSLQDWQTPLGIAKNDSELGKAIARAGNFIDLEESAHAGEHSLEVQLPFLQRLYQKGFSFVPICIGAQGIDTSRGIALAVEKAARDLKREVILIASSDFTHYEPPESARKKDENAIEKILSLDSTGFVSLVEKDGLSICGFGPIACAIEFARLKGCKRGVLLKYGNSGDASGDAASVVAYASIIFPAD